ncbi:MAG: TadE/TadG family protein [Spirochaetia bacterium]|nr:MAG: TadE/TadG family protein [Spirochaetia bacterium]
MIKLPHSNPPFDTRRSLRAFRQDVRGNVLTLTAFYILVLLAVVGSGVDMARAYTARTTLQNACDAAVLAGRRAMSGGSIDSAVTAETQKFFNFNFAQGSFGTTPFTPVISSASGSNQTVVLNADTTSPVTIMRIFGFSAIPIRVTCNAKQDFVSTDVVLVLDTTGSMRDKATSADSDTKIVALRKAVLALYDQLSTVQTNLQAAGMRLRYGIVPYASTVNVGAAIRSASPSYMVSQATYQTRTQTYAYTNQQTCTARYGAYDSSSGICEYFVYGPRKIDVSSYLNGQIVRIAGRDGDANAKVGTSDTTRRNSGRTPVADYYTASRYSTAWAGCTEERQTTVMPANAASIDPGAYDLDIDLIPYSEETRWRPYWPEIEYLSYDWGGDTEIRKPQVACPAPAAPMTTWTRDAMSNYLNTLTPDGGTYHDFGMIWGARWASSNGIFGNGNPDTYNNMPVKKYIIFMTDGLFDTGYSTLYSGYGVEQLDARVTPGGSKSNEDDQLARHKQRFNLLCSKAKTMGYSVWVVGFAQQLDTSLTNCASNAGQASTSANSDALLAKFVEIGKNIGALRLTQ